MGGVPLKGLCIHLITLMQSGFAEVLDCLVRHQAPMTPPALFWTLMRSDQI